MGFFKENKHANGTTSTDWGGSIGSGMGGMGGFAILIFVAMLYTYWIYAVVFLVVVLIAWGSWKLYSPKQKAKREERAINEIEQQYSMTENEFIADGNTYLISDIESATVKKPSIALSIINIALALIGALMLFTSVYLLATVPPHGYYGQPMHVAPYIGLFLIFLSLVTYRFRNKYYYIVLNLNSKEKKKVLKTKGKEIIFEIASSLNKIIKEK